MGSGTHRGSCGPTTGVCLVLAVAGAISVAAPGVSVATVPNIELHRSTSVLSSAALRTTTAACPAGRVLTGVGADIISNTGAFVLDGLVPSASRTEGEARGREVAGPPFAQVWGLHSYGICASSLPGASL